MPIIEIESCGKCPMGGSEDNSFCRHPNVAESLHLGNKYLHSVHDDCPLKKKLLTLMLASTESGGEA